MQYKDARIEGAYRYWLGRSTLPNEDITTLRRTVNFIMLNPSTADADIDDPTIRRCIGFATAWGFDTLHVTNLYAFRATKPTDLWKARDPIGCDNDNTLLLYAANANKVVCAWGANAPLDRQLDALSLFKGMLLHHLGKTKEGFPKHPLYLRSDTHPLQWV